MRNLIKTMSEMSKSIYLSNHQEELLERAVKKFSEKSRVRPSPGTVVEAALNVYLEQEEKGERDAVG